MEKIKNRRKDNSWRTLWWRKLWFISL